MLYFPFESQNDHYCIKVVENTNSKETQGFSTFDLGLTFGVIQLMILGTFINKHCSKFIFSNQRFYLFIHLLIHHCITVDLLISFSGKCPS